jgi:hypothetical protein
VLLPLSLAACQTSSGDDDTAHAGSGGSAQSGAAGSASEPPHAGASGTASGSGGSSPGSGTGGSAGSISNGGASGGAQGGSTSGGSAGSGAGSPGGSGGTGDTAGAGGTSAGSSNAGSAGAGAGSSGDPCATALLCDDFESYDAMPGGKWTLTAKSGTVAIDTAEHASGTKAVKFSTQAAGSATAMLRLQGSSVFPVDGNVVYGRMLFKLAAAPTASVHWTIIAGSGLVPGQTYHSIYRYGGQQPVMNGGTFVGSNMMANYETPDWYGDKSTPGSDCWHHANQRVIPVNQWTCVEWKFDGANNGMQLWLDGMPADDLTVMGHGDGCVNAANDFTWTAPNFSTIDLGWESYQQDDARTAWIDDVVISKTPIGCP